MELNLNINKVDIDKKVAGVVNHHLRGVEVSYDVREMVRYIARKYLR